MEDQQVADDVLQYKLSMSDGQIHKGPPIGESLYYPKRYKKMCICSQCNESFPFLTILWFHYWFICFFRCTVRIKRLHSPSQMLPFPMLPAVAHLTDYSNHSIYTSEVKSQFKKIKSKMPISGEQVWNDTTFNTSAGKLLNDRTQSFKGT